MRKPYTTEFKHETACLVLDQGYSIVQAVEAVGAGRTAVTRWVKQLRAERAGQTPSKSPAMTADQQQIQLLQAQVKRLQREKEILKKATALLMSDEFKS